MKNIDKLSVTSAWSMDKQQYLPYNYKIDFISNKMNTDFTYLS